MKKKIALVTGGYSGEAEVSYKSARTVEQNIDGAKYDFYKIDITPQGWFYLSPDGGKQAVDRADFTIQVDGQKIRFDAVLMCIHGTPGEDGKLQGYFDLLQIPYTTCDTTTSALTFNKRFTVGVAAFGGIAVAKSVLLFHGQPYAIEEIQKLQFPVFVKPNNGGSSIGMSKVDEKDAAQIQGAIDKAFGVDKQVLIEEYIAGREFTIGVCKKGNDIIALPMTEILKPENIAFFDFQAKYYGENLEVTPAQVDDPIRLQIEATARKIYLLLNCKGIIRIDFIYNEAAGVPYMLEVNTVPGQTAASLVPQQLAAMGWSLQDFYSTLIENASYS